MPSQGSKSKKAAHEAKGLFANYFLTNQATGHLTKVRRIYSQYISGCISVTKMNQVSPESLIKIFCLSGFQLSPIAVLSRAEDMFDMNPISLDALFSTAYRGLCCSTAHGKRQAAHHRFYCIVEVFETSWAVSAHTGSTALGMGPQPEST